MAGILNAPRPSFFRPIPSNRKLSNRPPSVIRASSNSESPPSSTSTATAANEGQKLESTFTAPPNFTPPKPQPFAIKSGKFLDVLGASLALIFRLGTGVFVSGYSASFVSQNEIPPDQYALSLAGFKVKETSKVGPRPEKPIEIYEFESCPFCRKVREIVAVLDIDVLFYPCPKNGPTFHPKVVQMGGKQQFPYMVDPNTGTAMYESDDIIKYLVEKYGDGKVPLLLSLGLLTTLTAGFALIGRPGKGSFYTPSRVPPKPLEIWAYEGSPFCKLVRETLVELELPHIQRSCARGSSKRQELYKRVGHFQTTIRVIQGSNCSNAARFIRSRGTTESWRGIGLFGADKVPYLEDPNTGVQMFESADIVEYLRATYALK